METKTIYSVNTASKAKAPKQSRAGCAPAVGRVGLSSCTAPCVRCWCRWCWWGPCCWCCPGSSPCASEGWRRPSGRSSSDCERRSSSSSRCCPCAPLHPAHQGEDASCSQNIGTSLSRGHHLVVVTHQPYYILHMY